MRMDDIVAQCPGVLAIHDNVFIYGKNDRDHDANIINLFNMAHKEGLIFNSKKCAIKQESVTFFGGVLLCRRILPRSGKDPRHLQDDTTPDEARAAIVPRSSKLPADICSSSQLEH